MLIGLDIGTTSSRSRSDVGVLRLCGPRMVSRTITSYEEMRRKHIQSEVEPRQQR